MLQKPLRAAGAMLTMRYPKPESRAVKGEGTIQAEAHGAHMVEGQLMCPMTPNPLRNTMLVYNRKVAADKEDKTLSKQDREARELVYRAERDVLIKEREKWELRTKQTDLEKNTVTKTCPAMGRGRSLECPLKPNQPMDLPKGAMPLPVLETPKAPGAICTNASSVTFSLEVGAKYLQHYRYGSPEWEEVHTYGRQTIESYNNGLKHADNSLHDSTNRRLRGTAGQGFLAIIGVVAQNGRVIYKLARGRLRRKPARHRTPQAAQAHHPHHAGDAHEEEGPRHARRPSRPVRTPYLTSNAPDCGRGRYTSVIRGFTRPAITRPEGPLLVASDVPGTLLRCRSSQTGSRVSPPSSGASPASARSSSRSSATFARAELSPPTAMSSSQQAPRSPPSKLLALSPRPTTRP